ncbi:MAG: SWIM zinc finger domain-containing protein [Planctomycetaceae bacterium]|nr:SWIM zinc finger domain-containing protein [Planctomycetaceae bacterium]
MQTLTYEDKLYRRHNNQPFFNKNLMTAIAHTYRYEFASEFIRGKLALAVDTSALKTPAKKEETPTTFFTGTLLKPKRTADLLRGVSEIVTARYNNPNWRRLADPVITVGDDRMRFEGFSGCCSAYARLDLLPEAVEGERPARGTTNVDFNPAMLAALASLRDNDYVALNIGAEQIELSKNAETTVERKVSLPVRWLKGFVEIQAYQARMIPVLEISGLEARRFLRSIPRTKSRAAVYILPSGRGLRLSQVAGRGGVKAAGLERLRVLENFVHYADLLRIYGDEESGTSAWELVLPEARFHLLLSCDVWRGFSGEGQVLTSIASGVHEKYLDNIEQSLTWESVIDVEKLSRRTGASPEEIRSSLAILGTRGLVGYDLETSSYFHRVLPFDLDSVEKLQPRLVNARKLIADGKVRITLQTPERTEAFVTGTDVEHFVRITETETESACKCTCPWYAKHQGDRGPCKHVLAVQLMTDEKEN